MITPATPSISRQKFIIRSHVDMICAKQHAGSNDHETIKKKITGNSRWLVDDVQMEQSSSEYIEIIITKWDSLHKG